jgi:hypothetical protein
MKIVTSQDIKPTEKGHTSPWQPLTFGGVAAFGGASFLRLLAVEFAVSLLSASSVVCLFYVAWEPSLREVISHLPDSSAIRRGYLEWTGPTPARLTDGAFVSIVVDAADAGEMGQVADLQFELRRTHFRVRSLLGYIALPYPPALEIPMNRVHWEPWWGAWHPMVSAALGLFVIVALLTVWGLLAAIYAPIVRVIAFYTDRQITVAGSWRLASASLMPGALLINAALIAYAFGQIILIQLLSTALVHLVVAWVFVIFAPLWLPRLGSVPSNSRNPFARPPIRLNADE